MLKYTILTIGILVGFFAAGLAAHATTDIQVVLDASSSMSELGAPGTNRNKFQEACDALTAMLQTLPPDVAVGLRLIGGTASGDCYSSYLYFTPATGQRSQFQDQLSMVSPGGVRALYQAIGDGALDFPNDNGDHVLLVIADAADACQTDSSTLVNTVHTLADAPRIVMFGIDLVPEDRSSLSELVSAVNGRLTEVASTAALSDTLTAFAQEFANNVRVHLQDSTGLGVQGDIKIVNVSTGAVVAETVDLADYTANLPPGTYQITARYLGQEMQSEQFTVGAGQSKSVSLTFTSEIMPFDVNLTDLFGNPLRARVSFVNSAGLTILTTGFNSSAHVQLPPDTYTVEVRMGDRVEPTYGVVVGPGQPTSRDIEVPIELAVLEAEVTNKDGIAVNGYIKITDPDGTVIDEAPNSSYLYSKLPPGTYEVIAKSGEVEGTQTVTLGEGDQQQVGVELDIPLGDLYVKLRTESGNDAWGFVRIYDSNGNYLKRFAPEEAESPDWNITDIPIGTYKVEATIGDATRTISGVVITANQETEITITFPDDMG